MIVAVAIGVSGVSAPSTSALDLGSIKVDLPLGQVTKPVTDLLSPVTESLPLPITLDSSRDTLGADVTLPRLGDAPTENPDVALNLKVPEIVPALTDPVGEITQPILEPVTNAVTPVTQPLANTVRPLRTLLSPSSNPPQRPELPVASAPPTASLAVQRNQSPDNLSVLGSSVSDAPTPPGSASIFAGLTSFFSSTLPDTISRLASGILGKQINPVPILISSLILLLTIATVGTIIYRTNHGGTLTIGRFDLTKFARAHDVTQLAALVVVIVSFGIVAVFLALAGI